MSISHWGMFFGYMTCEAFGDLHGGRAVYRPCTPEELGW